MGGRGSKSPSGGDARNGYGRDGFIQKTYAVSDRDGNRLGLIIESKNGLFWQNSAGDIRELPDNITAENYANRVVENGGTAIKLTSADLKREEAEYKAYREEMNDFLDKMWYKAAPKPKKGMKGH